MSDLISREHMKSLGATCIASRSKDGTLFPIVAIDELPPAQPRKGKWIKDIERFGDSAYHCDQCGAVLEKDDLEWRNNYYCYHCGAKMEDNKDE